MSEPNESEVDEAEQESVVEPFETDNPYLQKLFTMPSYGTVPTLAVGLLRVVTPDREERLLAAIKTKHGRLDRGYLLATTRWLRWIRTFPSRADDQWGYDYKLEYHGMGLTKAVIRLGEGAQFQTYKTRAKPFLQLVTVIQQAMVWMEDQAVEAQRAPSAGSASLADEIQKLAAMHQQGVLTSEEFQAAKHKLMS